MNWKLKVLGVRGSVPAAGSGYMQYGGNTSAFLLETGEHIFLDAGTGLCAWKEFSDNKPIHILITHVHLDHISGLPGFAPIYEKGREIHIYGERRNGKSIGNQLAEIMAPPFWPVALDRAPANICFHDVLLGKPFSIGSTTVDTIRLPHPDCCTGYRIADAQKTLCYLLDCELGSSADENELLIRFIRNSDAVILDGMYSPGKVIPGFGHSSWDECVKLAEDGRARKAIISHYSVSQTDALLEQQEQNASEKCLFAREGMEIEI